MIGMHIVKRYGIIALALFIVSSVFPVAADEGLSGLRLLSTDESQDSSGNDVGQNGADDGGGDDDGDVPSATGTSLSQYGITWTFREEVEYGTFVNGDYWVVGPVEIVHIDPASVEEPDGWIANGSMINPTSADTPGYDNRSKYTQYDHNSNAAWPGGNQLSESNPLVVEPGSSLVSTRSKTTQDNRPQLNDAAVLTVLEQAPESQSFRPGLVGEDKTLYDTDSIRWELLADLPATPSAPSDFNQLAEALKRPWILHVVGWQGRQWHPENNMPSYHREVGRLLSQASIAAITDVTPGRQELVINLIQVGIDYYTTAKQESETYPYLGRENKTVGTGYSAGDSAFYRWPIVFAGIMLGNDEIRDMWLSGEFSAAARSDEQIYSWDDHTSTLESDIVPPGQTWTGATVFWRQHTGNENEHEHLDPSEWHRVEKGNQDGHTRETYRGINSTQYVGMALAAQVYDAGEYLDHDEFLPYMDRWMSEDQATLEALGGSGAYYQSSANPFVDEMWFEHRPHVDEYSPY